VVDAVRGVIPDDLAVVVDPRSGLPRLHLQWAAPR